MKTIVLIIIVGCFLIAFNSCSKKEVSPTGNTVQNGTVTDIDGNVYKTVTIGTQTWMAENLKVTKYRNGDPIPNITVNSTWAALTSGAYCWYNNSAPNKTIYGALYNWYAVVDSRNLAPTGWHIPTDAEWTTLTTSLGGESVSGGKLKEAGTTHWISPNTGATNSSGFTALPGGFRVKDDRFFDGMGEYGLWWSNTEYPTETKYVLYRDMEFDEASVVRTNDFKYIGISVRCVKD